MTTKSQFRRPNFEDFINGHSKVRRTGQHATANMSSIDPYYDDDDRTVPRLGSIQFPGANEDTDCEEDGEETEIEEKSDEETEIEEESEEEEEEAKDLWKTNPLGSGLNETQKTVVDWDSEMEDARKAEENVKKTAEAVKQRVVDRTLTAKIEAG